MKIARVEGTVTSTIKNEWYRGRKLMVVQPLDLDGSPLGTTRLAIDTVQAGAGDKVLVVSEGNAVRQLLEGFKIPIRSLIVGIIDRIDAE